jgi:hypothetical protein
VTWHTWQCTLDGGDHSTETSDNRPGSPRSQLRQRIMSHFRRKHSELGQFDRSLLADQIADGVLGQ